MLTVFRLFVQAIFFTTLLMVSERLCAEGNRDTASIGGGSFALTSQDGKPFSDADLKGKYRLIFFGYSHCQDECPTTLLVIAKALNKLGDDKKKIAVVFITTDPMQDTPTQLKSFLARFDPGFIGLTGSVQQIGEVEKAYKVYAKKTAADKKNPAAYSVSHSEYIYFMDPEGKYLTVLTYDIGPQQMAGKIKEYIKDK